MSMFEAFWLVLRLKQKYSKCCISLKAIWSPQGHLSMRNNPSGKTRHQKRRDVQRWYAWNVRRFFHSWQRQQHFVGVWFMNLLCCWQHIKIGYEWLWMAMIWTHLKHRFASSQAVFGLFEGPKLVAYAMPWTQISAAHWDAWGIMAFRHRHQAWGFQRLYAEACRKLCRGQNDWKQQTTSKATRVKLPWGSILVSFYLKKWPTGKIYENIMSSCNHIVILNVIHFSTSQAFLMIFPMDFSHGKFRPSPRSPRSPSLRARPEYVLKKTAPGLLAWQGDRIQPVEVATFPAEVHHGKIQQLPWPLINVEPGLVNLQKTMERYGKSTAFWMGTSTNYITMFNSVLYVYQRVYAWEINALNNVNPRLINL